MKLFVRSLSVFLALTALAGNAAAAECNMTLAFNQQDNGGKTTVAVWSGGDALFFGERLHVNTDGTRRSYSVDDFWGTGTAINNLCNAMSDACAGLGKTGLTARRITTQKAAADGWPAAELAATRISSAIIPFKNGKPCPAVDGFLVSATALFDPHVADNCDIAKYVDALQVNAVVIPGSSNFASRAKVGDLAVIMSGDGSKLVYGVVGDTGPKKEIGEGTVALSRALLGKDHDPANYNEVRGHHPYEGQGWDVPRSFVLILAGTYDTSHPFMTPQRIEMAASTAFAQWGGKTRLKACAAAY